MELDSQNEDLSQLTQQIIGNRQALQRSNNALRESEARWRAVYENSAAGIVLTTLDGVILSANTAFHKMVGYAENELRGVVISELIPGYDQERMQARVTSLISKRVDNYLVQRQYRRKDGQLMWANVRGSIITGLANHSPMILRIVDDITQKILTEAELARARERLARVMRVTTMGELAASIAHEVNQPLAAIVTNGQAALRWLGFRPCNLQEATEAVRRTVQDANRASEIIKRIREFLKRGEGQRTSVDILKVVTDVMAMVADLARSHGIELRQEAAGRFAPVLGDRVQLQQVILNLVVNGLESIVSGNVERRVLSVDVKHVSSKALSVAVADSGPGIAPDDAERVFEAFYTSKAEGLGMGLAISRSIIEAHGGHLELEPGPPGTGAVFFFTLPTVE